METDRTLWTSPNKRWSIEQTATPNHWRGFFVSVVGRPSAFSGGTVDYPILIEDRLKGLLLLWDRPEAIPQYVQRKASKILIPIMIAADLGEGFAQEGCYVRWGSSEKTIR